MKRAMLILSALASIIAFLAVPASATSALAMRSQQPSPVSVQCGQTYTGGTLDFTNAHTSGHREVDITAKGNGIATITCPQVGAVEPKSGGYAVLTGRVTCNSSNDYFDLVTNNNIYTDCFGGFGQLNVNINQIDSVWWWQYVTSIAYTPPGQHWFYCNDNPGQNIGGRNHGLVNVINIGAGLGGVCPNPLP